jgi:hypothetical protein
VEGSGHDGGRGLRRNAVGLPGLVAQSLGVTAPEISAVVFAPAREDYLHLLRWMW